MTNKKQYYDDPEQEADMDYDSDFCRACGRHTSESSVEEDTSGCTECGL